MVQRVVAPLADGGIATAAEGSRLGRDVDRPRPDLLGEPRDDVDRVAVQDGEGDALGEREDGLAAAVLAAILFTAQMGGIAVSRMLSGEGVAS